MTRSALALTLALAAALAPGATLAAPKAPPPWKAGDLVVVKREGARLMRGARFYGSACAEKVSPGQQVRIAERQRGWARLASPGGGRCWLHESAWSDRAAGELASPAPAASQRDVELAARGFSEAEEQRFRGEHADLDVAFDAVEAHLARGAEPSAEELTRFVTEGGLGGGR